MAFKVVPDREDFQIETRNLDFLKESLSSHKHIVLHLAAIIHGSEFYIFLPYTELGSLEVFLCRGVDESPGTNLEKIAYNFDDYFPPDKLKPIHMLKQMLNLCGALSFLHDGLKIGQSDTYCAHMDLRPQNILIFCSDIEPLGKWKISDFGISSFKKGQNTKEQKFLSIRDLAENQTSVLTNRNLEGAHRSPENHSSHKKPFSGRKSDMWSYTCIFIEVLAFALGGRNFLIEFRKKRTEEDCHDAFFSIPGRPQHDYKVKVSVVHWLEGLAERFREEKDWIKDTVRIVMSTLQINPQKRLKAHEVFANLERLLEHHYRSVNLHAQHAQQEAPVSKQALPCGQTISEFPERWNKTIHQDTSDQDSQLGAPAESLSASAGSMIQRRDGEWRFNLPKSSSAIKDWSLSHSGDQVAYLLKHRNYAVKIFSTRCGKSNDPINPIIELPATTDWHTLRLAYPYLSIIGSSAESGIQVRSPILVCRLADLSGIPSRFGTCTNLRSPLHSCAKIDERVSI